ncbi:hypothetical protein HAX54_043645 [Datura stramonium]|uniref:Uncharacterized protein n=1 Tax=Datura stramonium TaxID=4076 RepID=A0ABS8SNQ7_DATST|nr:hypothetical protein [Datura stramonium]
MSIVSRFLLGYCIGVPSNHKSVSSQSYKDDSISNSSCLLIGLVALLLLLLYGLGPRAIIHCVLRHNGRFPFESAEAATARLASNGLKRTTIVMAGEPRVRGKGFELN